MEQQSQKSSLGIWVVVGVVVAGGVVFACCIVPMISFLLIPSIAPLPPQPAATRTPSVEPPARRGFLNAQVTMAAYSAVQNGMSYAEVCEILGGPGEELASNRMEGVPGVMPSVETKMYSWSNGDGTSMNAMFQNDKLMQKAQFGLD